MKKNIKKFCFENDDTLIAYNDFYGLPSDKKLILITDNWDYETKLNIFGLLVRALIGTVVYLNLDGRLILLYEKREEVISETQIIAQYEEYRKNNLEVLQKVKEDDEQQIKEGDADE